MTDQPAAGAKVKGPSKNEALKASSNGLYSPLAEEMMDASTPRISEPALQLVKFHGSYQQEDRDQRAERKAKKMDRAWQFMLRTKFPGGRLTPDQYLTTDDLATELANNTIRITTRQDFQFHGILKHDMKPFIARLNERLMTTYGGCGDIARNTLACPVSDLLPGHTFDYQALAKQISDTFLAESTAYYEVWLDGKKYIADGQYIEVTPSRTESFYGKTYMPRKHKMAIGLPNDNCIDIFTHDVSLEAVQQGDTVVGFNLIAGGGLGFTHGMEATYPRLGDRICYLNVDEAIDVLEAASAVYRDAGDRSNRKHARLKYVLAERGVAWFKAEVERYLGRTLADPADVPTYDVDDHLGWRQQKDGRWLVGIFIENGRIVDRENWLGKSGLRAVVSTFRPEIRLTAQQNIILTNIENADKAKVEAMLDQYGLLSGGANLSTLRRYAMACPAMPTCGLAVAEAERYLPNVITDLEARGYGDEKVWIRMSGCPNNCSRPSSAELGIIGRSLGLYDVLVGGDFAGTRLNTLYRHDVKAVDLVDVLASTLDEWRAGRNEGEEFGTWSARTLVGPVPVLA